MSSPPNGRSARGGGTVAGTQELKPTIDRDPFDMRPPAPGPATNSSPFADPPEGWWEGFASGLGTGGKAVGNAASDTLFGLVTVGGLVADDSSNPLRFGVTQQDIYNGYNTSYAIGRVSNEILAAVGTGGASALLGKGGQAAKLLGKGIQALDTAGNAYMAGSGVADAYQNGLGVQSASQILGGAFGVSGNLAGALGKTGDDLADAANGAGDVGKFAGTKAVHTAGDVYDPRTGQLTVLQSYCFAPETPVATLSGQRPIGEMRQGDAVLAYDHRTGQWAERQVAVFHESIYEGPLVTITTDNGVVRSTVYHPFWVLNGRDLDERSTPRELAEDEDQGFSLPGRWVNSHELRCGDVLIGRDGKQRFVMKTEQEFVSGFLVHNLTIDEDHTFAVGTDAVLVHNTAVCDVHGNSRASTRPATLYRLQDNEGNLLKWGVSQNTAKRYTRGFMQGKEIVPIDIGARAEMLLRERGLVMRNPGPLNSEPWAGQLLQ